MKKYPLITILLTTLLLTACDPTSRDPFHPLNDINTFNKKAAIFILRGVSTGVCETFLFRESLTSIISEPVTKERRYNVRCRDYQRKSDREKCYREEYTDKTGNLACVIGYNHKKDDTSPLLGLVIIETIIELFRENAR